MTKTPGFLADEHALATDPPFGRTTGEFWRRRLRAFEGRALSHLALTAEQAGSARIQGLRGQSVTAGTIAGLGVARLPEGSSGYATGVRLQEGSGLTRSGEDVQIRARTVDLHRVPVIAPPEWFEPPSDRPARVLPLPTGPIGPRGPRDPAGPGTARPRQLGGLLEKLIDDGKTAQLPKLAVLLAQPIEVDIPDQGDDPDCPPDRRDVAHLQPLTMDAVRLALFAWPRDVGASGLGPGYSLGSAGPLRRNHAADRIFRRESRHGRDDMHPWEAYGLPLALIGFTNGWQIEFVDVAAVQRLGGQPRVRTAASGTRSNTLMAEARLRQFSDQLAELADQPATHLRQAIEFLPPVGAMPGSVFDMTLKTQKFFPDSFDIAMRPAILEELGRLVDESASLDSFSVNEPDKVELLLTMPAREYDPDLFVEEKPDPAFAQQMTQLRSERELAIRDREILRRKLDSLGIAARHGRGAWPASDLDPAELAPRADLALPLDAMRGLELKPAAGKVAHVEFGQWSAPVTLGRDDRLFLWVRATAGTPPQKLRVKAKATVTFAAEFLAEPPPDKAAFAFPKGEGWHRLDVPATMLAGSGSTPAIDIAAALTSIVVESEGSPVQLGALGIVSPSATVTYLANGYMLGSGTLVSHADANEFGTGEDRTAAFGTSIAAHLLASSALASFPARWTQSFLAPHLALVGKGGMEALVADLERRLAVTNDAIDVGFVRARSDIYRLRQYILGRGDASRLLTSPALADLATRDESARASADDLAKFLSTIRKVETQTKAAAAAASPTPSPSSSGSGSTAFGLPLATIGMAVMESQPLAEAARTNMIVADPGISYTAYAAYANYPTYTAYIATPPPPPPPPPPPAAPLAGLASLFAAAEATSVSYSYLAPMPAAEPAQTFKRVTDYGARQYYGTAVQQLGIADARIKAADIVGQKALPGLVERTVTVAERLVESEAAKAHEFALAGKLAIRNTLMQLIAKDGPGVAIGDLVAPGYGLLPKGTALPTTTDPAKLLTEVGKLLKPVTLGEVLSPPANGDEILDTRGFARFAEAKDIHESDYFNAAVAALDDAIAMMRLVEGRVDLYQKFLGDAQATLDGIRADAAALEKELARLDLDIAELRHDLLVTEALEAEDRKHAEETNARRQALIARYGDRIVFRRPRYASIVDPAPAAIAADGSKPVPMVQCRFEQHELPAELSEYVGLLHEVPVAWFPALAREVALLNRRDPAIRVLERAKLRARALPIMIAAKPAQANPALARIAISLSAQANRFQAWRNVTATLDLVAIDRMDLSSLHKQVQQATSVADLIDNGRERPALARMASAKLEEVSNVAGCLNASFAEVDPVLRMRWSEVLSVHDDPVTLTSLAILPGWEALPIARRRSLQDFTDWLFAQIDTANAEAVDAISELVRIALLLAAHASVDQLIPATLIEPVPVRPGGLIPLRVAPDRVFLKQTGLVRDRLGRPVARFETAAIGADRVEARIVEDYGIAKRIEPTMTFAFGGALVRK